MLPKEPIVWKVIHNRKRLCPECHHAYPILFILKDKIRDYEYSKHGCLLCGDCFTFLYSQNPSERKWCN